MYANAQYYFGIDSKENAVIRVDINGVTSNVPLDPTNSDYINIMKLVQEGQLIIAPAS